MKHLLREPLVHFLLLGTILFGVYAYKEPGPSGAEQSKQIRLTIDDLSQLVLLFQSQWRRDPTPEELQRLVEDKVHEEVLYREALALGIDKDDTIVKRRMAQKMQFLAEDVAAAHEPSTADLKAWFEKNTSKFALPSRYSFRHLYFSPDKRGKNTQDDAAKALTKIAGQPEDSKLAVSFADPFMFQEYYGDRTPEALAKEFGPQFTVALEKVKPGSWQGPIESGYGWHLVFIDTVVPGRIPALEEIESDVKTYWLGEQKLLRGKKPTRKCVPNTPFWCLLLPTRKPLKRLFLLQRKKFRLHPVRRHCDALACPLRLACSVFAACRSGRLGPRGAPRLS
jgi:peptidyl-prolyl cis-trans isomerase C